MSSILFLKTATSQSVGVVLSGGGAKGLVHIGVLRALEEKGIPVDYIAGTSMGAIIAGLYASGYNTYEMETIFRSKEVNYWMSGQIEKRYMYFFKRSQPNSTWFQVSFRLDSSIFSSSLPTNLISPKQMDLAFMDIMGTADVASKYNFDSLMIPFRCNATDITHHKEIIFRDGRLKDAVRASMTFPFVFKPLILDSCILYDGGIMNNFPISIMENEFKPDYIIGVIADLFPTRPKAEDIVSIVKSMITTPNRFDSLEGDGIILRPPVPKDIGVIDFESGIRLIKTGYDYTNSFIDSIRKKVKRVECPLDVHKKRTLFKNNIPDLLIGDVEINGLTSLKERHIKSIILSKDEVIPFDKFKKRYTKLILEEKIESIYPQIFYDSSKHNYKVSLDLKQKKPFTLKFGGHISTGTYSTLYSQITYQNLKLQSIDIGIEGYLGRYYNAAIASLRLDYFKQPFFYQLIKFGAQRWNYFNTYISFYERESPTYLIQKNTFFDYSFSFPIKSFSKWTCGTKFFRERNIYNLYNEDFGIDTNDVNIFRGFQTYAKIEYNTTNHAYYASEGTLFHLDLTYQTGTEINIPGASEKRTFINDNNRNWFSMNAKFLKIWNTADFYHCGFFSQLSISNLPMFSSYTATSLHSNYFAPTAESNIMFLPKFRNPNFTALGVNNIFLLKHQIQLRIDAYYFQPFFKVVETNNFSSKQEKLMLHELSMLFYAAIAYPTKFGPFAISLSLYPQTDNKKVETLFNISFGYLIFENRLF